MKTVCDRATLTRAVQVASSVVAPKSPKPALGCIKLEARKEKMTLLATDLEVGIRVELDKMEVQQPGDGLVPADRLHGILRELEADTVTITSTDQETEIVAPGARFRVLGDNPADFPQVPEFPASGAFTIEAEDLVGMIKRTLFATAKENTRYALNGVLWEVEGTNLTLVATDGRRLSFVKGKCKDGPAEKKSAIVPSKAMLLIERCLTDAGEAKGPVRVVVGEKDILLESPPSDGGKRIVYSRLVDGHFPKYDDVIPKDCEKKAVLGAAAFLAAVRKAALLTNEESRGVTLKFDGQELVVTSRTPEMGEAEIRIPAEYGAEALEIGFNPQYLMDAVKVVDAEQFTFAFKGPSKPGVITEGRTFIHVVMPVSVV
ncbi:MAG: DNA polymerase III subunit beta [Planctomycetota bacterium]|nr:DNA polymerase III subunit beta [Planctomycetota bacterium]